MGGPFLSPRPARWFAAAWLLRREPAEKRRSPRAHQKKIAPWTRSRPRTAWDAKGTAPVVPAASRRSDPLPFQSARGALKQVFSHPQERIGRCAGQSASAAPPSFRDAARYSRRPNRSGSGNGLSSLSSPGGHGKRGRNHCRFLPPLKRLEIVEHSSMNRVNHTR